MRQRLAIVAFGALLLTSISTAAHAESPDAVKAFDEGRKLRDQRDFDRAASAFERSIAAEPSIGAYYNLAFSYEQLGRTRDALDSYRKAVKMAKDKGDAREKEASDAVAKLLETHNYVTLTVPEDVEKAPGLRIAVDNEVVPPKEYKGEVFRAAVQHEVVITATGRRPARLHVANKQPATVQLGEPVDSGMSAGPSPSPPPATDTASSGWGWQKWTGVSLGVAGLGAAVLGVVFTADYFSTRSDIYTRFDDLCKKPAGNPCGKPNNPEFEKLKKDADDNESSSLVRNVIAYGAGGLLILGGAYLFFTAPSSDTKESAPPPNALRVRVLPKVGARDTGLSVVGSF